jgi:hypothetical protein
VRPLVAIVDLLVRWLMAFLDTVIGDRGYLTVGSLIGAYLIMFGLIDAKSQQEETRASFERSQFMSLVIAGNAPSFVVAMKNFGPTQTMRATEHPELFKPWKWGSSYQPNFVPMEQWAQARLSTCDAKACSTQEDARIDLSRANLSRATLSGANLIRADLSGANLSDAALSSANLSRAYLNDTNLSGAYLNDTNLSGAILSRATLSGATLSDAALSRAIWDQATKFRVGFNPAERGMVRNDATPR